MIFRRRRADKDAETPEVTQVSEDDEPADEELAEDDEVGEASEDVEDADEGEDDADEGNLETTAGGPWDVGENYPEMERLDLGAVKVPVTDEIGVQVGMEEDRVVVATVLLEESALELMAFAAPKSRGIWDDVRTEMINSLKDSGGKAVPIDGAFGRELMADVPVTNDEGGDEGTQQVRFVGIDGPRWFLRGAFAGRAANDPKEAAPLEDVFRGIVVDRGAEAMAPQERIPMDLPRETRESLGLTGEEEQAENRYKAVRRSPGG